MNAKQVADELENIYWIQGDGKGKPFQQYANFVRQQQTDLDIALSYIKQYELQIKDLKQQVAFLEDWRDTWSPFLKAITGKAQEK